MSGRFLGIFCLHEWEEENRAEMIRRSVVTPANIKCVGVAVLLRCKNCGDMKIKRLSIS